MMKKAAQTLDWDSGCNNNKYTVIAISRCQAALGCWCVRDGTGK